MPPKMHKKRTYRELEALSMGAAQEASLSPGSGSSSGGAGGSGGAEACSMGFLEVVPLAGSVLGFGSRTILVIGVCFKFFIFLGFLVMIPI